MIESGEARVESILVELGDFSGAMAACDVADKKPKPKPRATRSRPVPATPGNSRAAGDFGVG